MSGSAEERDQASGGGTVDVPQAQEHEEVSSPEAEEPNAVVDRIRRIAASLDVHHLHEEELTALSVAARSLLDVAKAQSRDRGIASLRAQIENWERQHAEEIAGAGAEVVTNAVTALRAGVGEEGVSQDGVRSMLDLLDEWLTVDATYQLTHKKLKQAADEPDFELVGSLNTALASLNTDRRQASAAIDGGLAKLGRGRPMSEEPAADPLKPSEPEATKAADGGEEAGRSARQSALSTLDASSSVDTPESTAEDAPAVTDEGVRDKRGATPDSPIEPHDTESGAETELDPAEAIDDHVGSVQRIEDAIAMSIEHGRLGLAYHLSLAAPDVLPSANAIKLAAYSYVIGEHTPVTVAAELPELAAALLQEAEAVENKRPGWGSHVLLTTCAALAPALVAPGGPVAQLLNFLEPRLEDTPSLRALAKIAAEVSMTGVHLPIDLLRGEDSVDRWAKRESALRNDTKLWLANERQSQIKYQAATKVWRRMLDDWERNNGQSSLGRMFSLLDEQVNKIDVDSVARISQYWKSNGEKEVDRIDRENRSWKSTNKIEGPARLSLRTKVSQALDLSDRWIRLVMERPEKRLPFQTERARVLRTTVRNNIDAALAETNAVLTPKPRTARELLRRYATLFDGADGTTDRLPVRLTDLLHGDLLAHPDVVFDDVQSPADTPVDSVLLWDLVRRERLDFAQAAVDRAKRGDFLGAEAAVDVAERTGRIDDAEADRSRGVIENQRDQFQSKLKDQINETSNRLDGAYAAGVLTLTTYEQQRARLPGDDLSETNIFGPLFTTLGEIDQAIADGEAGRRDAIRKSLTKLRSLSNEDRERIHAAISSRRFQVAEDYIERIERGQGLPVLDARQDRPFDRFFPGFVDQYRALRDSEGNGILFARNVIASRHSEGPIDASRLSEDASRDGIELLDRWTALREGQTSAEGLSALMSALGFTRAEAQRTGEETLGGERVFLLRAEPVADRSTVQLPDFGSRAGGRYRLFAVRGRKTGEAIVREVDRQSGAGKPPNVVIFLGVLDTESRSSLARDFRIGEYHPTIVLDESLVVFLAAWSGNRLGTFFDCVSAFTSSQPFEPDAAELPPEMFFGRRAARQAILAKSHDMAHFVYGGRRLGKTTLLADIAREYRIKQLETSDELVLLINLKGSGIGENRPTEDLWHIFAEKLSEHGVVGGRTRRAESVGKGVQLWLGERQGRRILLLVDEADAFLDAECRPDQDYRVLQQVKTLMEETERKFKVVFAGLHNVQRAARDPNTPLAHLGEAIRIGPMLPETDGDEIENLIRGPLEALGYRFVSGDSVIRIAAETNYYPALAQQFCKELLKTLREEAYSQDEMGPPYPIEADLVDRVFNAPETRDRIRNLFSWTIHLDHRYEFLTYLIAQNSFDNGDGRLQAMPIASIRDAALSEWAEGFASDSSYWTFEVLMEEMVGLGILRETADKEYAIRTRNLRMLLGNDDEIERRFNDAKGRKAPAIFDRAQFRRTLEDRTRSSFTAHQEDRLLSKGYAVGVVLGTRLAGLDRVGDSLREARREVPSYVEEVAPGASPRSALRRALRSRRPGVHVILVDMRGAWDVEVVSRALAFVGKREWQDRVIRPVFLCGPEGAWNWLNESVPTDERVELRNVWLGPCGWGFAGTWLKEVESRAYNDLERSVDLPWPRVIETAAANKQLESIDQAIRVTLEQDEDNLHVADVIGISEATDTALRLLSTFSDTSMTADFLSDLCGDEGKPMSPEKVIDFFSWASRLGVLCRDEKGYRLDSTYAQGLKRALRE